MNREACFNVLKTKVVQFYRGVCYDRCLKGARNRVKIRQKRRSVAKKDLCRKKSTKILEIVSFLPKIMHFFDNFI